MIPDHESSLGPERYDPDWFLAQLSGREPDTARSAVEPVLKPNAPAKIADPKVKGSSARIAPRLGLAKGPFLGDLSVPKAPVAVEPEPIVEPEPEPEPIAELEPVQEIEPVVEPEPIVEPVVEPEPVVDLEPEPIVEPELAASLSTLPIAILRPVVPVVRRGAVVAAAAAALLFITGAALAANRGVEPVAIAAGAPDKLPTSVSESTGEDIQLPTLVLPEDSAPPADGTERGWSSPIRGDDQPPAAPSTPDAPAAPTPSPGAPTPAPAGTPDPEPTTTPDPEPTTPAPDPDPSTPAEPDPEPSQPADPDPVEPDPGPTGIPLVDDLCELLGLCS